MSVRHVAASQSDDQRWLGGKFAGQRSRSEAVDGFEKIQIIRATGAIKVYRSFAPRAIESKSHAQPHHS
jgi:hypothetical protein